jgi:hypothetical protein
MRKIRGMVLLAACVGLWSCSSDPTADQAGVPDKIVSLPSVVFVAQDSTEQVAFQLVDALDGQIPAEWTLDVASPLFSVSFDSTFRPIYNPDGTLILPGQQTEARATISGIALGVDTLNVSAGGKSLAVVVNVVPGTLHAVFTPANPAPGDTVTMTMPPELRLTPTSAVTFPGNLDPIIVSRAADSLSLRFISAPTTKVPAVVTKVYNTQFPTIPVATYPTELPLIGTKSGAFNGKLPVVFSSTAPGAGPITATLDPTYAFKTSAPASVFTFPTQTAPILNSVSADSAVANITVAPNVASPLQVTRITFRGAPQFEYTLVSPDSVKSTILIPTLAATLSPTNPRVGDTVSITAPAGYTFGASATVSWPLGSVAIVTGSAANVIKVLPMPGSSGAPTVSGIISPVAPLFQLTLPATLPTNLTMQNISIYGGRGDPATATVLTIPPVGTDTLEFYDLVTNVDQYYNITVPANETMTFRTSWPAGPDMDMLFCNAACTAYAPTPAVFGGATGANPENATVPFTLAQGPTYNFWLNNYAGGFPAWVRIRIIRTL